MCMMYLPYRRKIEKKKGFAIKDKNKKDIVLHYKKHAFVAY